MFLIVSAAVLSSCSHTPKQKQLPDGVTLVESEVVQPGKIGIPFKKYRLDNGLTVILHQDDSDPLVHVDVTYHVGSDREKIGKSGFAHLFEHMMFQGSQHVADEQHFKIVTEAGGTLNGTTNSDRTNYYETVPNNQLEKMLWLESDRMGFLLPALTEKKFEVQRETVKNERAQRIDNRPYGRMSERFNQAMYPVGHPYSWPVIGWPADLNRANVDDVKAFFARWYGPNNATLTIGGDFNEKQALAWVDKYFGGIPRGPEVKPLPKTKITLEKTHYLSMEDRVHLPLLRIGFPTVYARHQDEAPLDLLANILGGGKTSILYQNLVKNGVAVQASASHPCSELACQMTIIAVANPSKDNGDLSNIDKIVNQSIAEFEKRGVTDEDLEKVKADVKADTIFGLQSVSGKVSTLAYNETFTGEPDQTEADLKRYSSVTKADVMRVFNQYIKNKPMVVMSVVPEGKENLIAHADNFKPVLPKLPEIKAVHFKDKRITSNFDRSVIPPSGSAPIIKVPNIWRGKLANGIDVMSTVTDETPTVELVVYLNGGHRVEPVAKSGLAEITAAMMNESTQLHSNEELAQKLDLLGSSIQFDSSGYQSVIQVTSLTENLDKTLTLLNEKLFKPGFKNEDFQRIKQQMLQGLKHQQTVPTYLASVGLSQLLYGKNSPLGVSSGGSIESVSKLTLADVKRYYKTFYTAANAQIIAVSNLKHESLVEHLGGLSHWKGKATSYPKLPAPPKLKGGTIYLIDKPKAAQSVVMISDRALKYDATGDYFKASLMNYPLGGAFNSRINLNLREDKGYTYGARSGFSGGVEAGSFTASASVRTDVTAESVQEFIKEIVKYQKSGMTDAELDFMRKSITQGQALDYETPYQKAGFMRTIQRYKLADDFTEKQAQIIESISKDDLNKLASKLLNIDDMIILVVGDKEKIEPKLKKLGYPIMTL
ncbi:peptidase M16 [Shewanella sp. OPT22]|nr:peptidase M16 [Shewanella sp. OPT22]